MEAMHFSIIINAPREKVWETLWNNVTYREWTSAFAEGSDVETDWKQGSKVLFHDGKGSGMVSMIAETRPPEYMSFKHLGMVKNGVEDTTSPAVQPWSGALENYTLHQEGNATKLDVAMSTNGIPKEMLDYFNDTWPKALAKLKAAAER